MTTLLAIETSSDLCSVALACDGGILDVVIEELRGHSRHLLPAIDRLLAEAGLALGRLDAIVVSDGPGSFTGLRIGIGVAQGLAYGADLPAVPLSSLATLVQGAIRTRQLADEDMAVAALDARMNAIYWGLYRAVEGVAVVVRPDRVDPPAAVAADLDLPAAARVIGLGDGWNFAAQFPVQTAYHDSSAQPLARDMIPLARAALRAGAVVAPEQLEPRYLRESHWQKLRHSPPADGGSHGN